MVVTSPGLGLVSTELDNINQLAGRYQAGEQPAHFGLSAVSTFQSRDSPLFPGGDRQVGVGQHRQGDVPDRPPICALHTGPAPPVPWPPQSTPRWPNEYPPPAPVPPGLFLLDRSVVGQLFLGHARARSQYPLPGSLMGRTLPRPRRPVVPWRAQPDPAPQPQTPAGRPAPVSAPCRSKHSFSLLLMASREEPRRSSHRRRLRSLP